MLQILPRYSGGLSASCSGAMLVFSMLLSASVTHAQVAHDHSPLARPAAADIPSAKGATPTAAVSPLSFESTLSTYKPMTDQKLGSWREANDTVTRIGGWRSYLKEAQAPDAKSVAPAAAPNAPTAPTAPTEKTIPAAPATPATPTTPTAANPHAGHGAKP